MAGFAARAAGVLRDPLNVVVAAIGAGAAWAVGLPVVGVAAVGAGMLGAAVVAGAALSHRTASEPVPELARGTAQRALVDELDRYRRDLLELSRGPLPPVLVVSAGESVDAADRAGKVAVTVAAAVDALDRAIARAASVGRRMPASTEVRASIDRMSRRRDQLLAKLAAAVTGVGEVYTGLLELSATAPLAGMGTDGLDDVHRVNDSLDALRGAFEELEVDAASSRALL